MTQDGQDYHIAEIRNLLMKAFTAKELRRFCNDRPTFRPILDEFAPDHGVADMVDQVIAHCQTRNLWNEFLAEVALVRRSQYARFQPRLGESAPPTPTATEAGMATARTWPSWYWVVGALILALLLTVGVWWFVFRPENGPGAMVAPTPFLEFFRVFPSEVQPETPVSISWHVQNADSVEVRPLGIYRGKPTYEITDWPRGNLTYELYVNGTPTPIESRLVRWVISPLEAPAIDDFSVTPNPVIRGVTRKITLKWDSPNAERVAIAGVAPTLDPVWEITLEPPEETIEYKLVAWNEAGRRSRSIQVFVVTPTPMAALALTPTATHTPTPAPIYPSLEPVSERSEDDLLRYLARPIGMLVSRGGACTASVLSDRYIITADFCIREDATDAVLRMGFLSDDLSVAREYAVDPVPVERSEELHYAILKVAGNPASEYGTVPILTRRPVVGESMFGAMYVDMQPLALSHNRCLVLEETETDVRHSCSTGGGSAGALLYSASDYNVLGLHHSLDSEDRTIKIATRFDVIVEESEILSELAGE